MFLVLVDFHNKIAQTFQVLLLLLLLFVDPCLDKLPSEVRMYVEQRQQKFIDDPFGEEEIMIDNDSFFIIIDELLVALS